MQGIKINFTRPQECPVIDIYLYCIENLDYNKFTTLVDTGAAFSVINLKSFKKTGHKVISGHTKLINGFGMGSQECEFTAIYTKLKDTDLKAVGYYIADLSNTKYDVIIGMPFLKNFDFLFKFDMTTDYSGQITLYPRINLDSLVNLEEFSPLTSNFGIYSLDRTVSLTNYFI